MRHYTFHPDDWAKEFGNHKGPVSIDGGAILVRDAFGVAKAGEYIVIDIPDEPPRMRFVPPDEPIWDTACHRCQSFFGVDWASGMHADDYLFRPYIPPKKSLKRRAREQRRLDWESNVRRRKRKAELEQRRRLFPRKCLRCNGKGYHHGFGEHGHDPDWCEQCGGCGVAGELG